MPSVCKAVPLKPGMWDTIVKYRDELVSQLEHQDVAHAREHRGFKVVKIYHQASPFEALVLYFEADDLQEAFHPRHQDHQVTAKWNAFWKMVSGIEGGLMGDGMPQQLINWHHEEGHAQHRAARAVM